MSSPSQNNYDERLQEKLQQIANKRGVDSPQYEELYRLKSGAGVAPKKSKSATEKTQDIKAQE